MDGNADIMAGLEGAINKAEELEVFQAIEHVARRMGHYYEHLSEKIDNPLLVADLVRSYHSSLFERPTLPSLFGVA